MANYLCMRCRSNDCLHIPPSLHRQMVERYMNGDFSPYHNIASAPVEFVAGIESQPKSEKNKLLLLLRR